MAVKRVIKFFRPVSIHRLSDLRTAHGRSMLMREIRYFKQRIVRGWDNSELWSLDYSLAKLILPRLRAFRSFADGKVPCDPLTGEAMKIEEWRAILDKMIAAFEFAASDERWNAEPEEYDRHQEGINLFSKHFFSLWN